MAKFKPGQSGNPAGKRPGTVCKMTKLRQSIEADLPEILSAMVTAAKQGDTTAAKLVMDRVLPALRPTDQAVSLPLAGDDLAADGRAIIQATGNADITPEQASRLLAGLGSLARVVEVGELIKRIESLEAKYGESDRKPS
ncbi:hypothetical protein CCR95_20930 [Thiocystis minor]|uniref:DUF5681 domain-containing protein n=1 Tax=Thiocystis minor TaxID=61597 RepID=UPI0019119DAB|nr:DUF5681 domain-containing protein [Thiocystis minor]MBK5966471.1 hypothetical protein [Thiocystis minor]